MLPAVRSTYRKTYKSDDVVTISYFVASGRFVLTEVDLASETLVPISNSLVSGVCEGRVESIAFELANGRMVTAGSIW